MRSLVGQSCSPYPESSTPSELPFLRGAIFQNNPHQSWKLNCNGKVTVFCKGVYILNSSDWCLPRVQVRETYRADTVDRVHLVSCFQTIVAAMSTLAPPIQVAFPDNQRRLEYITNLPNQKNFEFTSVSIGILQSKTQSQKRCRSIPIYSVWVTEVSL